MPVQNSIQSYLDGLSYYSPLTQPQQDELFRIFQMGVEVRKSWLKGDHDSITISEALEYQRVLLEGEKARHLIILHNLRFVVSEAITYSRSKGGSMDDYIQEGTLGLMHAMSLYDPSRGFGFLTYARHWIMLYMKKHLEFAHGHYRVPERHLANWSEYKKFQEDFLTEHGYNPEVEDWMTKFHFRRSVAEGVILALNPQYSLSYRVGRDNHLELLDVIPDNSPSAHELMERQDEIEEAQEIIQHMLGALPEKYSNILAYAYAFDDETIDRRTFREVGQHFNISKQRVSELVGRSLGIIRTKFGIKDTDSERG